MIMIMITIVVKILMDSECTITKRLRKREIDEITKSITSNTSIKHLIVNIKYKKNINRTIENHLPARMHPTTTRKRVKQYIQQQPNLS
jgi:hypothetical protein